VIRASIFFSENLANFVRQFAKFSNPHKATVRTSHWPFIKLSLEPLTNAINNLCGTILMNAGF